LSFFFVKSENSKGTSRKHFGQHQSKTPKSPLILSSAISDCFVTIVPSIVKRFELLIGDVFCDVSFKVTGEAESWGRSEKNN